MFNFIDHFDFESYYFFKLLSNNEYMPQLTENDLITNTSNNFVLSWKDQVKNGNVKIIVRVKCWAISKRQVKDMHILLLQDNLNAVELVT